MVDRFINYGTITKRARRGEKRVGGGLLAQAGRPWIAESLNRPSV